jgi:hypothetical protein
MKEKIERGKEHVKRYKEAYIVGALGLAGITCLIMRDVVHQPINRGISVVADRGISVVGKKVTMNNVSYVSANRQGPPSWRIRCLETKEQFESQRAAAMAMGLPENEISKHLNGLMDHVRGNHFERIGLAI